MLQQREVLPTQTAIMDRQGRPHRISERKIVAQVGDNPNEKQRANYSLPKDQWKDGICNSPHGASIDKDGSLVIFEWTQFGHLHKFDRVR